eukprot:855084-Prymnesium_polylepis.1
MTCACVRAHVNVCSPRLLAGWRRLPRRRRRQGSMHRSTAHAHAHAHVMHTPHGSAPGARRLCLALP